MRGKWYEGKVVREGRGTRGKTGDEGAREKMRRTGYEGDGVCGGWGTRGKGYEREGV